MDDALAPWLHVAFQNFMGYVLILVVMDDALAHFHEL